MLPTLAALIAFLSGFTDVRIGDIQSVEFAIVIALALSFLQPQQQARIEGPAVIIQLLPRMLVMLALIACGSFLSLRLQFYPPSNISIIKTPPFATIARLVEVVISVSSLFIVALGIRNNPRQFKLVLAAYGWAALANAGWGIAAFGLHFAGLDVPGITLGGRLPRIAGFFNEGGPLGVYLAGGALIQYIRGPVLHYISRRSFWISIAVISLAIVGSQSKAAVLVILLLTSFGFLQQRRASLILVALALVLPIAIASNLVEGINGYYSNLVNFRAEAYERSTDGNLVNGRLMASVILPRIVEAHPFLGVGIGNYSLVRNDPNILLGLPRTELWDLHGLGLLGYLAELGIPLTLFVLYMYAYPVIQAMKSRAWIFLISCYPLLAALFGVQLNFAYPWVVMGLALGAISIERSHKASLAEFQPPAEVVRRKIRRSAIS
ncbi:hypothetical protein NZL82_18610 [Sphingomonas sanguinis]|jgi:hypothetical protein|uniref:hypothetical protein n=1 Tax=Sphingomonas sp. LC-1 TaxID=3110957 RepID=UPI0021BA672D|nr:hypothetical protein [Sphingomonas sp. LC-1]MCT8003885.1 hypothetical protein [Sphingomonas sp. LC-1]